MATKANSKNNGAAEGEDGGDAPLLDLNEASVKKLIARAKKRGYITYEDRKSVV
jgi:RNA polymerase primary sigma factor